MKNVLVCIKKWKYYRLFQKPISRIIDPIIGYRNVKKNKKYFIPDSFIPHINRDIDKKIKVRFLFTFEPTWNSIVSICRAFANDLRYDVLIVLGDDRDELKKMVLKEGLNYEFYQDYSPKSDYPDIFILSHPSDQTKIEDCRKYTKIIIVASSALVRYGESLDDFWKRASVGYERFSPDYYLFDSLLYNEIKESKYFSNKIIEMGNAKFDGIHEAFVKKDIVSGWSKLRGKKIILWAPDHGIQKGYISDNISFDIFAKSILEYFGNNDSLGLIFRPHATFVEEMLEHGYWTTKDIFEMKRWLNASKNMIWDDNATYDNAYAVCDAILTDAHCGIICSALPTLKPVGVLFRDSTTMLLHEEFAACTYKISNDYELKSFLDMVSCDDDYKLDVRKELSKKNIKCFDGKNGERIKAFIEEKYSNMIGGFR